MSNLSPVIKSIQDVMRQDAGINGDAQRIEQMVWLLFLKVLLSLQPNLSSIHQSHQLLSHPDSRPRRNPNPIDLECHLYRYLNKPDIP
jgi:hypothetical protein